MKEDIPRLKFYKREIKLCGIGGILVGYFMLLLISLIYVFSWQTVQNRQL